MKLISILLGVLFLATATFAQDKIVKHTGDTITCKVTEILENSIKYKYEGEELTTSISFSQVDKILFSSGRIQKISEKIVISGEEDWEKVSVTNIPEEVFGLVKKGEVSGKATGAWGAASNAEKVYAKALEKLKREAAKKGAHLIFTKDLIVKDGDIMTGQWAKSMVNGIAYGYQ